MAKFVFRSTGPKGERMANPKSSVERRKEPRFPVSLPLEYQSVCDSSLQTGLLANLSHKGLLFHCRGDMSVGTLVIMTVMFPDDFSLSSFEVHGKIIWKRLYFDRDWREYEYGVEFLYVSGEDQEKLDGILSTYSFWGTSERREMYFVVLPNQTEPSLNQPSSSETIFAEDKRK